MHIHFRSLLAIAVSLVALIAGPVQAEQTLQQATYRFDLPEQPLADTLRAIARQTGANVLFESKDLKGIRAPALQAQLTAQEAIRRVLAGTRLAAEQTTPTTVIIKPLNSSAATPAVGAPVQVARLESLPGAAADEPAYVDDGAEDGAVRGVPEILVQGSRTINMDIKRSRDDAQPYVIFDRETIQNSGAATVEDFLRQRLTMETTVLSESQANSFLGTRSSINLRGLGTDETLILVDGHRMAGVQAVRGVYQPDVNGIPLSAIERIEILPTSASGIYGGSATGGVVNIVLRRDYAGLETKLTYDNTFASDSARRRVDLSGGFALEGGKTTVLVAASYSDGNRLLARERDFATDNVQRILANSPSFFYGLNPPPTGATPNIRSRNGSNLVLDDLTPLNSPITYIPYGYQGPAGDGGQALVANAGKYNLDLADSLASGLRPLINTPTVQSAMVTLRRDFTPHLSAFLELGGSNNTSKRPSVSMPSTFNLPADHPHNPFTTEIRVTAPLIGLDGTSIVVSHDRRMVTGLIARLPRGWMSELDVSLDRSRFAGHSFGSSGGATADVLSGALNVMRDLNLDPIDFSPYIDEKDEQLPHHARMRDYTFRASGPVFELASGPVNLSMLLERREETFEPSLKSIANGPASGVQVEQEQSVNSAYLEALIPLVGRSNGRPGMQELELQIAGRWDDYETSGANFVVAPGLEPILQERNEFSSTDSTFGLRYRPMRDLVLRASYATGFLPPAVNQIVPIDQQFPGFLIIDPKTGEPTPGDVNGEITISFGGNPNLKPERSSSWSAGLIFEPRFLEGLRLSVDWYQIDKRDNIIEPDLFVLLDNEDRFPGRIIRGTPGPGEPFGPILGIDASSINIARAKLEGFDVQFDYNLSTQRHGDFQVFALGTFARHHRTQTFPDSPMEEHVGIGTSQSLAVSSSNYPVKFRGNMGLVWNIRQWTAGWTMRYVDSYLLDANNVFSGGGAARIVPAQGNGGRVDSQHYHDVYATYRFDGAQGNFMAGLLSNTEWQLGVRNVFNRKPPLDVSNAFGGYYSGFGDPRLASYYISVKKRFD